jgi:hypothetical protein
VLGRVDIGVEVDPTANGSCVDEPALTGAEDGDGPRIKDDGDGS